jgi:hypothetical protein
MMINGVKMKGRELDDTTKQEVLFQSLGYSKFWVRLREDGLPDPEQIFMNDEAVQRDITQRILDDDLNIAHVEKTDDIPF